MRGGLSEHSGLGGGVGAVCPAPGRCPRFWGCKHGSPSVEPCLCTSPPPPPPPPCAGAGYEDFASHVRRVLNRTEDPKASSLPPESCLCAGAEPN